MKMEEFIQRVKNGRFFTLEFIKRTTGELRVMNCRLGVKAHVKGVGRTFDPKEKDLLGVFDLQKQGYRFINLRDPLVLKMDGKKYNWNTQLKEFIEEE